MSNSNEILAIMELKGLISHEEAERVADKLQTVVSSASYNDALALIKPLLDVLSN